ncbi:MAG: hypothetical protein MUD12_04550 [Spirochaetes bacterium]|jgi:hypothetical protein|nr:hypothetical protein [Spirochaetota bacterium]
MKKLHFVIIAVILGFSNLLSAETGKCISGDCINGHGALTFDNGNKYVGEFKNGKQHGQGTLLSSDGKTIQKGTWLNGVFFGVCTAGNCINGQGSFTTIDGSKFIGQWKNGKPNGQMTYTNTVGDKYIGQYKDGVRNGKGTFIDHYGDSYVGQWKDGKYNGQGELTNPNGKYVGQFKDGKRHGQGTLYIYGPRGTKLMKGRWEDNRHVGD